MTLQREQRPVLSTPECPGAACMPGVPSSGCEPAATGSAHGRNSHRHRNTWEQGSNIAASSQEVPRSDHGSQDSRPWRSSRGAPGSLGGASEKRVHGSSPVAPPCRSSSYHAPRQGGLLACQYLAWFLPILLVDVLLAGKL